MANDATGTNALVKRLVQIAGSVQVICEASGGYERALIQALQRGGIKVSLVQASRVRQYARASGILAKTDSIDARVLCGFGQAIRPPAAAAPKPHQEKLREVESQRRHLSCLLVAEQNRRAQLTDRALLKLSKRLIDQVKKRSAQIDLLVQRVIEGGRLLPRAFFPGPVTLHSRAHLSPQAPRSPPVFFGPPPGAARPFGPPFFWVGVFPFWAFLVVPPPPPFFFFFFSPPPLGGPPPLSLSPTMLKFFLFLYNSPKTIPLLT